MKLLVITVLSAGYLAHAQICSKIVEYNACMMTSANNVAACSTAVTSVPTFEYWDCVCNAQNSMLSCYSICPDDVELQRQRSTQEVNKQSTCKYVTEQKLLGAGAAPKVETIEPTKVSNTTVVNIPKPVKNNTATTTNPSRPGGLVYDNGAGALNVIMFLPVLFFVFAF